MDAINRRVPCNQLCYCRLVKGDFWAGMLPVTFLGEHIDSCDDFRWKNSCTTSDLWNPSNTVIETPNPLVSGISEASKTVWTWTKLPLRGHVWAVVREEPGLGFSGRLVKEDSRSVEKKPMWIHRNLPWTPRQRHKGRCRENYDELWGKCDYWWFGNPAWKFKIIPYYFDQKKRWNTSNSLQGTYPERAKDVTSPKGMSFFMGSKLCKPPS